VMKKRSILPLTKLAVLAICTQLACGCAATGDSPNNYESRLLYPAGTDQQTFWPDKKLKKTFCEYWQHRYTGNFKEAYQMEASKYREHYDNQKQYRIYVKRTPNYTWMNARLEQLTQRDDGVTLIKGKWVLKDGTGEVVSSKLHDQWVKEEDGKWYHGIYNPIFIPLKYGDNNKNGKHIENHNTEASKGGGSDTKESDVELDTQTDESETK